MGECIVMNNDCKNGHFIASKLIGPGIFAQDTSSEIHKYHRFQSEASNVTWTNL